MVKLKDIADKLGVTVATVSYALNNDSRIPESTRQRVAETAKEMGYQGKSGKVMHKDCLKQIVLCIHSFAGDFYRDIVETMSETFVLNNCNLLIYVGSDISKLLWADGLLVLNSRVPSEEIARVTAKRIPVILMDRQEQLAGAINVTLDNFAGCAAATQCAVDAGAKTFAFIGGPKESYESHYRYNGFCDALAQNKLQQNTFPVLQTDFTYEGGLSAFQFLIERGKIPDAIVCANDETAFGIMDGLKNNGLSDVIVTGFDGVVKYSGTNRFVTAKSDHKHWATTSAYSMIQLQNRLPGKNIQLPVHIVEYNM